MRKQKQVNVIGDQTYYIFELNGMIWKKLGVLVEIHLVRDILCYRTWIFQLWQEESPSFLLKNPFPDVWGISILKHLVAAKMLAINLFISGAISLYSPFQWSRHGPAGQLSYIAQKHPATLLTIWNNTTTPTTLTPSYFRNWKKLILLEEKCCFRTWEARLMESIVL